MDATVGEKRHAGFIRRSLSRAAAAGSLVGVMVMLLSGGAASGETDAAAVRPVSGEASVVVEAFAAGPRGGYQTMDYGPVIGQSVATAWFDRETVSKALAVRVPGEACLVFDTDTLRFAAASTGGWIDISRTDLAAPKGDRVAAIEGQQVFGSKTGPGWTTGDRDFVEPREEGLGNLPRDWGRYGGYYRHGDLVVLDYEVFGVEVLDLPGAARIEDEVVFTRKMRIGPSDETLVARVGDVAGEAGAVDAEGDTLRVQVDDHAFVAGVAHGSPKAKLRWDESGRMELVVPPADEERSVTIVFGRVAAEKASAVLARAAELFADPRDPATLIAGGPARWGEIVTTAGETGEADSGYVSDRITMPEDNPWGAWMRPTGFDFFPDGERAAVSTMNGDVWIVSGLDDTLEQLEWKRFASGLFYPMGVVVDGEDETIYVIERSQLTRLHDLDGDGEADLYESFNNDHYVHPKAHALTLHRDAEGYFYFFRNGNRVPGEKPHHGRMMRVSPDGQTREMFAHGFRGANGMAIGGDGTILAGDQEGDWVPATRIDRVERGGFYGYRPHGGDDRPVGEFEQPICWLPRTADASAGEQAYIPDDRWGPLAGRWVHTSYSHCQLFVLFYEEVEGQAQGGVVQMPLDFPAGLMRARFNRAGDGQLYVAGLGSWGSMFSRRVGSFDRVRYVGGAVNLPESIQATERGLEVRFTDSLDADSATDAGNFELHRWQYRYTGEYGSAEYSIEDPDENGRDEVELAGVELSDDGRTILLAIPDIQPAMQMRLGYRLEAADGASLDNAIYHTVHKIGQGGSGGARP